MNIILINKYYVRSISNIKSFTPFFNFSQKYKQTHFLLTMLYSNENVCHFVDNHQKEILELIKTCFVFNPISKANITLQFYLFVFADFSKEIKLVKFFDYLEINKS